MAMVVKNNMSAVRTLNTLNQNSSALSKSLSRVSSGMKINSAQDDAAGYAISERMRVRIRSLDQANQNTQNDSSLMKTAEGAVANTVELLRALKEKAINAANDSNTDEDRQTIQKELNQFIDQIDDNALVQFNGKYLVDGSKNNAVIDTKTVLLNQSLEKGTLANDALTTYNNRAGDSLGILSTDKWQVSYVKNGTTVTSSGTVEDNSLADILSQTGVTGTVAATSEEGLIGTEEADPVAEAGFQKSSITAAKDATGLSLDEVKKILPGLDLDTNALTAADDTHVIEGFYTATTDADGKFTGGTAVTITVKAVDDGNGGLTYDISGIGSNDDTVLYQKKTPTSTLVDKDYNALSETGYLTGPAEKDAVTLSVANFKYASATTPGSTLLSNIGVTYANLPTTATALGDYGVYTANEDADGNITSYTKVTTTIVKNSDIDGSGTAGFELSDNDISGKKLYIFDTSEQETLTKITSTVGGNPQTAVETKDKFANTINVKVQGEEEVDPQDKFEKKVYTPDKTYGVAFVAEKAGVNEQVSGLTISIMDQDGNVKKAANAALDQFKQYQRAENKTGDMSLNFHIGSEANVAIKVGLGDMRSEALGLKGSNGERILVTTKENANAAINVIENALTKALDQQTTIGAVEARLEYTATNLTTSSENVQAAESTIRDADMAKEMTNYTKNNVLLQAAQAMLAQANQNSSAVLSLLQ